MKALYRKYRPTKLSEVIGQDQVTKPLENSLKSGKISHAYIFIGPRGCGKTSVARIFAHEVNKFPYEIEDDYTDIIEIDGASNTGVDNIRELKEKALIAPTKGKYKVYIIDEVHMLSKSAFNALLKTLEEPPKHVIFIMATTDAYKIPATITSRSQVFNFNLATPDVMRSHLEKIAKKEAINIESDALDVVISEGGGSFRDSISLLEQISSLSDKKITKELVISALGLPEEEKIANLLTAYKAGDTSAVTDTLQNLINSGIKSETVAEDIISQIVKRPEPELLPLLEKLLEVSAPFPEAKLLLAFLAQTAIKPVFAQNSTSASQNINSAKTSQNSANVARTAVPTEKPLEAPVNVQKTQENVPATSNNAEKIPVSFDWDAYKQVVSEKNSVIARSLNRIEHQLQDNTLTIYAPRKFDRTILESDNNLELLKSLLPSDITLEFTEEKLSLKKDGGISKISDIMGDIQEVDKNGIPF